MSRPVFGNRRLLAALILLSLSPACRRTPTPEPPTCTVDCPEDVAQPPPPSCESGSCQSCTTASECATGICHESGRCEASACATDDMCPADEICDGNQCLPEPLADTSVCGVASLAFALDSAKLSPGNQERLAHATPCLLEQLDRATLGISAHGDGLGSDDYQRALAQRRAASIHAFLLGRGLPENRLRVLEETGGQTRSAQLTLTE